MREDSPESCLSWLLATTCTMCEIREVPPLLEELTDAFLTLTGGDRAYLLLCEAGPEALMPVAARGPGGLATTAPDRRVLAAAKNLLTDRAISRRHDAGDGRGLALALLGGLQNPTGVLFADGKLREGWAEPKFLEAFAKSAALALDNARLFDRASNDLLTGLPNNSFFMQAVHKAIKADDPALAHGVLLLDLDNFKRVNEASNRDVGDRALIDVAHTLRDTLSADGLVARFGSDKFGVLLSAKQRNHVHLHLRDVAERARAAVGAKVFGGVQLSCCIGGLALARTPTGVLPSPQEVLSRCDQILSRVRVQGNAQIAIDMPAPLPEV